MHPLLLLSLLLQIGCAVHVLRTGRPMYWLFLLLIGSYVAVAIYLLAEILPELRHSRGARRVLRGAQERIDPERRKREASRMLEVADTLDNRLRLAEESLHAGDFRQAVDLYRSGLHGQYATDPHLMLGLARAQFALGEPAETRGTLEALIAANPDFRSADGHLLYARALEACGEVGMALEEYQAVTQGFPGEEARVRFGLLLKRSGRHAEADALFAESLKRAELSPRYYRRDQREWLDIAKREISPDAVR